MPKTYYKNWLYENLELRYDGDIINGKYHGNGKLYYLNGIIEYEGNFIDGKFHGNGILYYVNGIIRYSGEFVNHKAHGLGKVYNSDGTLIFEGMFKDHCWYEGKMTDGIPNGYGKLYFVDMDYSGFLYDFAMSQHFFKNVGLRYEGYFLDGKFYGNGTLYICRHDYKFDHELGTYVYKTNNIFPNNSLPIYSGGFNNNKFDGVGELYTYNREHFDNNDVDPRKKLLLYSGHFKKGFTHGFGTLYPKVNNQGIHDYFYNEEADESLTNNTISYKYNECVTSYDYWSCVGEFVYGVLTSGKVYNTSNILKYEGGIEYGKFIGYGKYYNDDGTIRCEGIFKDGLRMEGENI